LLGGALPPGLECDHAGTSLKRDAEAFGNKKMLGFGGIESQARLRWPWGMSSVEVVTRERPPF